MSLFGNISFANDWRTADRSSVGIAPKPDESREAIVQVYAARAFNWRGIFAVHTWIAIKHRDAETFTIHQVLAGVCARMNPWSLPRAASLIAPGTATPRKF